MNRLQEIAYTIVQSCLAIIVIWATIILCIVMWHAVKHIDEPSDLDKQWQIIEHQEKQLHQRFKRSDK